MKLRWLVIVLGLLLLAGYIFINMYKYEIATSYIKIFPTQRDKSLVYWMDLTNLLFFEAVRVYVFIVATMLLAQFVNMQHFVSRIENVLLRKPWLTLSVIISIFTILATIVAVYILDAFPNSSDEYAYIFQAEVMSRGKLWDTSHPLSEFFEFHHIAHKDNVWISRFPPGWPLLLAGAFSTGIPLWIVNPLLGAVALFMLYKFCMRFYNERVALWATIATGFTACYIFNAGSFFSHTASFLEFLLFVYFLYLYIEEKKFYQILLAGFFIGLLAITRYFTAFLVFIPFAIYLLHMQKWKAIPTMILLGVGALPPLAYLLWYNYSITGDPLMPVTMWAYADESLGFVNGHTPAKGIEYIMRRILMFIAWVSPSFLILYAVLVWIKIKTRSARLLHPEDYAFVLLVIGHIFYYHHGGNQYGPRFYFEAIPFMIIFAVAKALRYNTQWSLALLVTGILYAIFKLPIIADHERKVIQEREDVYAQVEEKGINNAVIFLSNGTGLLRPMPDKDLTRNDKHYKGNVLYALDLKGKNKALMQYYKGRKFYIYVRSNEDLTGTLIEVKYPSGSLAEHNARETTDE